MEGGERSCSVYRLVILYQAAWGDPAAESLFTVQWTVPTLCHKLLFFPQKSFISFFIHFCEMHDFTDII